MAPPTKEEGSADALFMAECFKHLDSPASVSLHSKSHYDRFTYLHISQINVVGVATALGYKNHRSVSNRIAQLRKKYNLNLTTSTVAKASDAGPSSSPAVKKAAAPRRRAPAKVPKSEAANGTSFSSNS